MSARRFKIPDDFGRKPRSPIAATPSAPAAPISTLDCWQWVNDCAKIGLACCVVEVKCSDDFMTFAGPGFEQVLGVQLTEAELGLFENLERGDPIHIFYLLSLERVIDALDFIKRKLDDLRIAPLCTIAAAEPDSKTWRIFYPPSISS